MKLVGAEVSVSGAIEAEDSGWIDWLTLHMGSGVEEDFDARCKHASQSASLCSSVIKSLVHSRNRRSCNKR